ncbi:hypothetical protein GGX14DRAFT_387988 [Mycena pura]|uniref:Uncharacterized protein n=1 Tax=Mycena pura TaxID=153505 RepID=A0AAD6VT78_9AGAR|nr:hypothetical protein GGX14DRAFT_387988 [Mycena pura]
MPFPVDAATRSAINVAAGCDVGTQFDLEGFPVPPIMPLTLGPSSIIAEMILWRWSSVTSSTILRVVTSVQRRPSSPHSMRHLRHSASLPIPPSPESPESPPRPASKRSRNAEVDESNIVRTSRVRAPTKRLLESRLGLRKNPRSVTAIPYSAHIPTVSQLSVERQADDIFDSTVGEYYTFWVILSHVHARSLWPAACWRVAVLSRLA